MHTRAAAARVSPTNFGVVTFIGEEINTSLLHILFLLRARGLHLAAACLGCLADLVYLAQLGTVLAELSIKFQ